MFFYFSFFLFIMCIYICEEQGWYGEISAGVFIRGRLDLTRYQYHGGFTAATTFSDGQQSGELDEYVAVAGLEMYIDVSNSEKGME